MTGDRLTAWLALSGVVAAGLVGLVVFLVARRLRAARRLAAEIRILVDAHPDHEVHRPAPRELAMIADAVQALAERRRVAEADVAVQVAEAGERLAQERNRLAALMAQLGVAVVVCNAEGRILLYNAAARATVRDESALGIGRPVQGIVDQHLLDHAALRLAAGSATAAATTTHRGRVLEVRVAPVAGEEPSGVVLLLEDLTERLADDDRRNRLVRELTEELRSSVGSLRAAAEALQDYPAMAAEERAEFLRILAEDARRLGERVDRWGVESGSLLVTDHPRSDLNGADLLRMVESGAERAGAGPTGPRPPDDPLWVRVESHALTEGLVHLALRLREHVGETPLGTTVRPEGGRARFEIGWAGPPVPDAVLRGWAEEPVAAGAVAPVGEVVARHDGELWSGPGTTAGTAYLAVLLPVAGETQPRPAPGSVPEPVPGSRPEFYDFDLFEQRQATGDLSDRPLRELSFTVFDTETTGLDPAAGDEIVAVGAVRVVNGRLLRQEAFERLVDPRRGVPATSTAIHGLTRAMLQGQPTVEEVLPELARYAEDTVLVGHNVGFDLQFLRVKEASTGVRLTQPVLDTLLLDAVAHPDHEEHALEAITARLGVEVHDRHSALGDAVTTAEVFLRLVPLLEQLGIRTLGEALAASRATLQARLDRRMYGS